MRTIAVPLLAITMAVLIAGTSVAETVYVGDRLVVTLREIPEDAAPTIDTLKSDDALELLEEGDVYYRVRTVDGAEGYIKKQYLTRERPKSLIIADLERQLAQQKKVVADIKASLTGKEADIRQANDALKASVEELQAKLADSTKELEAVRRELAEARKDYETLQKDSGDVVSIVKAREALQKENDRLTDELNTMREDNIYLLTTFYIKWFLAGAGVMFVGWLIGKSSRRKRRY